jgi:hypothetical protein
MRERQPMSGRKANQLRALGVSALRMLLSRYAPFLNPLQLSPLTQQLSDGLSLDRIDACIPERILQICVKSGGIDRSGSRPTKASSREIASLWV